MMNFFFKSYDRIPKKQKTKIRIQYGDAYLWPSICKT